MLLNAAINCFEEKLHVKIPLKGGMTIYGYVVDFGKIGIVVHKIEDFHLDGYCIIPYTNIKNIYSAPVGGFHDTILKNEGIFSKVNFDIVFEFDKWTEVGMQLTGKLVEIIGKRGTKITNFGKIEDFDTDILKIRSFSYFGELSEKIDSINYNDILLLAFDNEYLNTFDKYINI